MTRSKVSVPVYARKAIETGNIWQNPPCIEKDCKRGIDCPANINECPHAEIIKGSISSAYWAKCNARQKTLDAIALYKKFFDNYTSETIHIR